MSSSNFEKVRGTEGLYRYLPNGKYYARFVVHGKEVRQSLKTTDRTHARRELARMQVEQARIDPTAGKISLAVLADRYLTTIRHQAPKTIAASKSIPLFF